MKPSSEKAVICGHVKLIALRSSLKTFPRFEEIGKAICDPSGPGGEEGKWERSGDRSVDRWGQVGSNAGQVQSYEVE